MGDWQPIDYESQDDAAPRPKPRTSILTLLLLVLVVGTLFWSLVATLFFGVAGRFLK